MERSGCNETNWMQDKWNGWKHLEKNQNVFGWLRSGAGQCFSLIYWNVNVSINFPPLLENSSLFHIFSHHIFITRYIIQISRRMALRDLSQSTQWTPEMFCVSIIFVLQLIFEDENSKQQVTGRGHKTLAVLALLDIWYCFCVWPNPGLDFRETDSSAPFLFFFFSFS